MENISEKDLHYYFDSCQSIIVIINENKKIDYINDFGAKILGYEKKELVGKDWFENIIPKINRQEIKNVFNNLMEGYVETFKSYLSPVLVKNGTEKIISWKNSLIKDKSNRIIATLSIGDDISAHEILQEELKVQKDIKVKIIEASPVAITVVNQKGKIVYANDHAEKILGLSRSNITKRTYKSPKWSITDYDGNPFLEEKLPFSIVKRTKKPVFHIKHTIKWPNGEIIYLDINATPILDADNNFNGTIAILQDVTEEVLAKREIEASNFKLKQSERMYRALFEGAPFAILLMDQDTLIRCNKKTLEMYGCDSYEDIIGKKPWDFSPKIQPDGKLSKEKAISVVEKTLKGNPQTFYWINTRKDGSIFNAEVSLSLIKVNDKPIIQTIVKDISDLKKAFNRAEFYKDLFAHDINNILQGNLTGLQLIEHYVEQYSIDAEEITRILNLLKSQVNRGAKLVANIRKLSELEKSDGKEHTESSTDALRLLKRVVENIEKKYHDKEISIKINSNISKANVKAGEFLNDVFENILINAIKHNNNKKIKIKIQISREIQDGGKKYIKFCFIDNARGIEASQKKLIFLRDHKDIKGKKNTFGLGLGLTLVKRIVDYYGGQIWVEDKVPGDYTKGSKFKILIPESEN